MSLFGVMTIVFRDLYKTGSKLFYACSIFQHLKRVANNDVYLQWQNDEISAFFSNLLFDYASLVRKFISISTVDASKVGRLVEQRSEYDVTRTDL